jgi:amidase
MFEDALVRARQLDQYYQQNKRPIGPLHGIVMTLKDQFDVKGYDSTLGYCGRAFQPAQQNALLVDILQGLGAIFIAKTNIPQRESATLAQMGSMVGLGTDIGGSIRIPSHMMGLYGLKPSHGRFPYDGVSVSTEGQGHVPSVTGPLARSLASLQTVTKAVIDAHSWNNDPQIVPIPWRHDTFDDVQRRPLVIGLLTDDGIVRVHPPIRRVLEEVADKLRSAGHEIVLWNAEHHAECIEIMVSFHQVFFGRSTILNHDNRTNTTLQTDAKTL